MTRPTDSALISQLERTMRTLNKRVYAPSMRALRALDQGGDRLDKGSFVVLAALEDAGQLRPSDLATIVDLDLSTVSRHVRYFEQLGFLARIGDPDDGRASLISLTDAGNAALASIRAARVELLDTVFASWSARDRIELQRLLDQLLHQLCPPDRQSQTMRTSA